MSYSVPLKIRRLLLLNTVPSGHGKDVWSTFLWLSRTVHASLQWWPASQYFSFWHLYEGRIRRENKRGKTSLCSTFYVWRESVSFQFELELFQRSHGWTMHWLSFHQFALHSSQGFPKQTPCCQWCGRRGALIHKWDPLELDGPQTTWDLVWSWRIQGTWFCCCLSQHMFDIFDMLSSCESLSDICNINLEVSVYYICIILWCLIRM